MVRIILQMTKTASQLPFKTNQPKALIMNKLKFIAYRIVENKTRTETDEFRTKSNVRELSADLSCMVILDELSRPDEISYALARQIMQESLVDDEAWYESEDKLIAVVDYLMKFDKTLLRRAMTSRNYFKKFVKSALEVVQSDMREKTENDQRYNKLMHEFKDPQQTGKFLDEPYNTALSAMCAGIDNDYLQPVGQIVQAALMTEGTHVDCAVEVNVSSRLASEVWTAIAGISLLMACLNAPLREHSLSGVIQRLSSYNAERVPETIQRVLKCYRCLYQTRSKRYLMRHIKRVHKKPKVTEKGLSEQIKTQ